MASFPSNVLAVLGSASSASGDSTPMYFALALEDSEDGMVKVQIDDESYMGIFLEEDEVECDMDESMDDSLDSYYEELDESEGESDDEDSMDSDYDNENASSDIDEED